jgi:hypothetical protein
MWMSRDLAAVIDSDVRHHGLLSNAGDGPKE